MSVWGFLAVTLVEMNQHPGLCVMEKRILEYFIIHMKECCRVCKLVDFKLNIYAHCQQSVGSICLTRYFFLLGSAYNKLTLDLCVCV